MDLRRSRVVPLAVRINTLNLLENTLAPSAPPPANPFFPIVSLDVPRRRSGTAHLAVGAPNLLLSVPLVIDNGSLAVTLDAATVVSTATVAVHVTASVTLGQATLVATATTSVIDPTSRYRFLQSRRQRRLLGNS